MAVTKMNAKELHEKIDSGKPVFILDVRNPDEYNDWKIEGKNIQSINIPYFDFLDENETTYKDLPKDTEIIVICAKGGSALMVAELLDEKGYKVSYLEKGMLEWSQFYHPVTVVVDENIKLFQINRLAKGCLSYMVVSEGQAMVVDPNRHIEEYTNLAEKENAKIVHIMDTHLHADHISGGRALADQTGATYYISSCEMQGTNISFEPLEEHDEIHFGAVRVKILTIPTPGHTPGSVSFLVNDQYLLSGDTIFVGGLGRPDLGGKAREWAQSLYETVFKKIALLSDDIIVLPAHYADIQEINENGYVGATLGDIRRSNEIMRTEDREQFTEMVAGTVGATPPNYEEIIDINRGVIKVSPDKATELEIGPNRCAIHHS
ncbi:MULTISPECIES: MBL fold metallo-hydrolase [unclassified Thermoactinomyces]|uniref:MBL fold metallo-hydrolase n=1 Tax=unclassified Thermoactinomyces TaxID=2634588 RepID=UPI0018DD2736|nr:MULTISPECIES: MBL fold metallo-hydrolase [unclassified Thermoactinomyces]MBH8598624.1 MBL fold metallo-hydrolase [Thermoactinomyces sp. CICC 10523]MBH8605120.1 MBL fold metallo-hydrolase [Thermoactinomyces sp. CICC 10522]